MVVLQKSDNQLYADIVRSLKQNFRSEFQPPFVAPHGERKVRIRTGCHYKSQLPEDHWREKYNRNVKVFEDFIRRLMFRMLQLEMFVWM